MAIAFCFLFLLLSSATACDHCVHQSKVSYFSKTSALSSGACGYGSLALGLGGGHTAAAVPSLYKDGAACGGTCFQVRCMNKALCSSRGTTVVVTDLKNNNKTDLVLSSRAFRALANKGMDREILKQSCGCGIQKGGYTEILGVVLVPQVQVGPTNRIELSRKSGAVWETDRVPKGPLQFGFPIIQGFDVKWIWANNLVPANWQPGVIYDIGVKITDVNAMDGCAGWHLWN